MGTKQWKVLVMGLKNSGAIFQRVMEFVLDVLDCCHVYIDDIIIGSRGSTPAECLANHERDLRLVLDRLAYWSVHVNPDKAKLFMREVVFCGHILRAGGRSPAPDKLMALQKWELPHNVTQLRGFLGLANYYSCYLQDYALHAGPIMEKLKLDRHDGRKGSVKVLKWTQTEIDCFHKLKFLLSQQLQLFRLNPDQPFILRADASDRAVGAVLEQERDGKWVPVGFFSRKLAGAQLNWTPGRRKRMQLCVHLLNLLGGLGYNPSSLPRTINPWRIGCTKKLTPPLAQPAVVPGGMKFYQNLI